MAPHLEAAAAELGDKIRVGKIDSDKYPAMAQKLKAGGVPTVLILNGNDELQRIEGAMMKDQILRFVEPYIWSVWKIYINANYICFGSLGIFQ